MSAHISMRKLASPQLHADRLIVATNRGPVEYSLSQDNELKPHRGTGGMVTALIETGNRMEVTWVAMAMTEGDRVALNEARRTACLTCVQSEDAATLCCGPQDRVCTIL